MTTPSSRSIDEEYAQTYAFLCTLERFGILLGLENISQLLDRLGNPHRTFPVIHVGGSNGKGSTSSYILTILRDAGIRTALYTSPHLNDFRERIRINGRMVSKEAVIDASKRVKEIYDPDRTTYFEYTTAIAFQCIAQAKPDLAIIEVGLGGRLDATNTVSPIVTVITDISREHEDYLGQGIKAVAGEKAGIIKPDVPLITGATRKEAKEVILGTAVERGSPAKLYGRDFVGIRTGLDRFTYTSDGMTLDDVALSMPGAYQVKNASLACAVIEELECRGYEIPEESIRQGLRKTRFPGRFEIIKREPTVIIDGAHTPESMRLLKSSFRRHYPSVQPFILLGMLKEKNYAEMIRVIAPLAKEVVCVRPQGDRALDPEKLAREVKKNGVDAVSSDSIEAGLDILLKKASKKDTILAVGSLYMIGPVRKACGLEDE